MRRMIGIGTGAARAFPFDMPLRYAPFNGERGALQNANLAPDEIKTT